MSTSETPMIEAMTAPVDVAPTTLAELLDEVQQIRDAKPDTNGATALLDVIRKHHFWPALQVKKFFSEPDLVLLHNTYKRVDVAHFQKLYDECRSVVLDMAAPAGQNIIVSYASTIPDTMVGEQYKNVMSDDDSIEESFDGTVVTVYNYKGKWYFGTSSCPTVDSSRFHDPVMTHGKMFDDAIETLLAGGYTNDATRSDSLRAAFTASLDPSAAYAFILVHHKNGNAVDYTARFGDSYAKLVHIVTRDRATLADVTEAPALAGLDGIIYPRKFGCADEALEALKDPSTYALLVTREDGKRIKVARAETVHKEECDLGNPNKWINMLWVYMQNRPDYHITDYQKEFVGEIELPLDFKQRPMAPTYLIHTSMCNIRDMLYQLYCNTTTYYTTSKRFKMNKDLDAQYPPIIRFHLAQLRNIQVQHHTHAFLSRKAVYHYLCFHQTLKNVRALIQFFAEAPALSTPRAAECFRVLHGKLSELDVKKAQ